MKPEEFKPVNLWVAVPLVMQAAIAAQMLWGSFGNAWDVSWLCSYVGVVLCIELYMYNNVLKAGKHPIKALYPILLCIGFAFFFTAGFLVKGGWSFSWGGLVFACIGILVVKAIEKAKCGK